MFWMVIGSVGGYLGLMAVHNSYLLLLACIPGFKERVCTRCMQMELPPEDVYPDDWKVMDGRKRVTCLINQVRRRWLHMYSELLREYRDPVGPRSVLHRAR